MANSTLQRPHSEKRIKAKHGTQKHTVKKSSACNDGGLMSFSVHECRFLPLSLCGVTAVATSPSGRYIVLARSDHNVELKDRDAMWATTSATRTDSKERKTVYTSMVFSNCGSYVFAARAHGAVEIFKITEDGLLLHVSLTPGGGKIAGMALCRDSSTTEFKLALACADGRVRILRPDPSCFSAHDDEELPTNTAFYETLLSEKTMASVTCVAWYTNPASHTETCIAAGDKDGGVRWINPSTGSCYGSGKIPSLRLERVVMRTIQFSRDGKQVLCGDSRGLITVWSSASNSISDEFRIDGSNGEILSSAPYHHTESSPLDHSRKSEVIVFGSAGGEVAALRSVPGTELWSTSRVLRIHTHKVRSIAALPNGFFVSSSIDSFLTVFPSQALAGNGAINWLWPNSGCVGQTDVQLYPDQRAALSNVSNVIQVWSFPRNGQTPVMALRMNLERLSGVQSCSLNAEYGFLAVSTLDSFEMFKVCSSKGNVADFQPAGRVVRVEVPSEASSQLRGAIDMVSCGKNLVCLSKCRQRIHVFDGARIYAMKLPSFDDTTGKFFCKLASNPKREKLMVSDSRGNILVCSFGGAPENGSSFHWRLMRCPSHPATRSKRVSAMSFSSSGKRAVIAYTDLSLCVLNLSEEREREELFDENDIVRIDKCISSLANSVSFASTEEAVLVTGASFSKAIPLAKTRNSNGKHSVQAEMSLYERGNRFGESLCCASVVGPAEVIIVSHNREKLLETRPTTRMKRKFGT